jgi:hypothetical protein
MEKQIVNKFFSWLGIFNFLLVNWCEMIQSLPSFALILPKLVFNSHKQKKDKKT